MNSRRRVDIRRHPTGVPGLDEVLGGGLPEYSFNLVAGEPGTGKTTLVQQIMFSNATPERSAIYFTVLGEPPAKMLRYQQQFSFFDFDRLDDSIRFVNLSEEVLAGDLGVVLDRIVEEVEERSPGIVIVDSFRTVVRNAEGGSRGDVELQSFIQRLALHLTGWQATTFLVGEYTEEEAHDNPVFTVADSILWLRQDVEQSSIVRRLQAKKIRGQAPLPGMHSLRITSDGIQIFPRMVAVEVGRRRDREEPRRLSTGVPGLDEMMGGGIPAGDATLVAGTAGSGKTILATSFAAEAARLGESAVIAVFEERPREYLRRARELGVDLEAMEREGSLRIHYLRPMDLSVDETLHQLRESVQEMDATRVVIDSLTGFEVALAPGFRSEYREALYRMVAALTSCGTTVLMTIESLERFTELRFTPHEISFLSENILLQRYVELEGELQRVMMVVKMRGSDHSRALRRYQITSDGIAMGDYLHEFRDIITGVPRLRESVAGSPYPGLRELDTRVIGALLESGEASSRGVAEKLDIAEENATRALERLVELRYAIRSGDLYRAAGRPLGQ